MHACLQNSIDQYQEILAHAGQLEELLSKGNPELLQKYTERLQQLQAEAGLHDGKLLDKLASDPECWQNHPLFVERTQLLKQIVEMNNLLLPRIRGMMSVTAAELAQIKDGRVAVAGYHSPGSRPKGSVRSVG